MRIDESNESILNVSYTDKYLTYNILKFNEINITNIITDEEMSEYRKNLIEKKLLTILVDDINKIELGLSDSSGKTKIMSMAEKGNLEIVKDCVENEKHDITITNAFGNALFFAALNGHSNVVEYLINKNIPLNVISKEGPYTAYTIAFMNCHDALLPMLERAGEKTIETLLKEKIINKNDENSIYINRSENLLLNKKFDECLQTIKNRFKTDTNNVVVKVILLYVFLYTNQEEEAIKLIEANKNNTEFFDKLIGVSDIYASKGITITSEKVLKLCKKYIGTFSTENASKNTKSNDSGEKNEE